MTKEKLNGSDIETRVKTLKKEIDIKEIIGKEKEYYIKIRNFKKGYEE